MKPEGIKICLDGIRTTKDFEKALQGANKWLKTLLLSRIRNKPSKPGTAILGIKFDD